MSRSEKKVPIIKDHSSYSKHLANKKVRHSMIGNYSNYKKVFESWNICDYKRNFYKTHGITYDRLGLRPMTYNEIMEYWRK